MALITSILLIVGIILLISAIFKFGKTKDRTRVALGFFGVIFIVVGTGLVDIGLPAAILPGDRDIPTGKPQPIVTMNVFLIEDLSNSPTAVIDGVLEVYDKDTDPGDASVSPLVTIPNIGNGQLKKSSGTGLNINTLYRVIYAGNGSWYSHDFGIMSFDGQGAFDDDTNQFDWRPDDKIQKQATIDDFLDETTAANLNGQTNTSIVFPTNEIGCAGDAGCSADGVIIYDESQGDGTYYIDLTFSTSGSNSWIRDYSICFDHESGAEPEGNEITSIIVSSQTGSGFDIKGIAGTDDLVNFWANELCINLGDIKAGNSEKWRLTFTVDENNLDASDDYKVVADDLGTINGKTVDIDVGVTSESADFDAQA